MARSKYRDFEKPLPTDGGPVVVNPGPALKTNADDEFRLAPAEKSDEFVLRELEQDHPPKLPLPDCDRQQIEQTIAHREQKRFSLRELLGVTTFLALGFGTLTWFPLQAYVGVVGLMMAVCMLVLLTFPPQSRTLRIAWGTAFAFYFAAAGLALLRQTGIF